MSVDEIIKIANQLSNDDLAILLTVMSSRIRVHIDREKSEMVELDWVSTNGTIIQIDLIDDGDAA
tara:strand:- start:238 stop:432 length:195 start_codon:yes stop_codon:yes gene_type:complete